jgi:hypothetical protein
VMQLHQLLHLVGKEGSSVVVTELIPKLLPKRVIARCWIKELHVRQALQ